MNITQGEEKRIKKTIFTNLIFADVVTAIGLLIYFLAGHSFEIVGFFVTLIGVIWMIMTIAKFIKFKRFMIINSKQP
jgi:hypothetical protein